MKHNENTLEPSKSLIPSLLKVFAMFQLLTFYNKNIEEENDVEAIASKCRKFNKDTGLHLKDTTIEEMVTKFVLNALLHHVGMLWKIFSNN